MLKPDGRRMTLYSRRPISDDIRPSNPIHDPIVGGAHLRWHPLRGEWVAYASHRQNRTFLPPKEYSPLATTRTAEFPTEMPAGDYDVAVFDNLFPSLSEASVDVPQENILTKAADGVCEVVVFTQNPETSLGLLSADEIQLVLEVWADRTREVGGREQIQYVMPFENRGVEVGVTLHHPHGQIYAYPFIPPVAARMLEMQTQYFEKNKRGLLTDFLQIELQEKKRIIHENKTSLSFIPSCARYPYETWIAPKRSVAWLHELEPQEFQDLALNLKAVLMKFDLLWNKAFPYLMVLYQAPTDGKPHLESHAHIEIYPALRSKDRLKFLAGTEIGAGMFVNDTWPEEKAAELRAVEISQ